MVWEVLLCQTYMEIRTSGMVCQDQMWSVTKDRLKVTPMFWPEKLDKWSCLSRKFFAKVRCHLSL